MSTLKVNTIQNASGVEKYLCQAWVNFNGTGTVAIRASGNVSSITDNGTGDYTINFTNAFADANYVINVTAGRISGGPAWALPEVNMATGAVQSAPTTSSFRMVTVNHAATGYYDVTDVYVSVFR